MRFILSYVFMIPISILSFSLESSFLHFLEVSYSGNELPQLLFIWKALICSSLLNLCWLNYSSLTAIFFQHFECIIHSSQTCAVSAEKPAHSLTGLPLCAMSHSALAAFRFPLSLILDNFIIM